MFGPHFRGFSLKTCQKLHKKYTIIVQNISEVNLKTLGNIPKRTICILRRSYICVEVTSDDNICMGNSMYSIYCGARHRRI